MESALKVPHGDETVTVELTVKEAMALTGIRFYEQRRLLPEAFQKLNRAVERKTVPWLRENG